MPKLQQFTLGWSVSLLCLASFLMMTKMLNTHMPLSPLLNEYKGSAALALLAMVNINTGRNLL